MTDDNFWRVIGLLDWKRIGNDAAVLAPALAVLAAMEPAEIIAFEEILSAKLQALDTEGHARRIGDGAYTGPDKLDEFDTETFLAARCCVVANGRKLYDKTVREPRNMPRDLDFDALLTLGPSAYEQRTGTKLEHTTAASREAGTNAKGWKK